MKFVIVEDEIRIREGIHKLLKKLNPDNQVVGEADNGCDAIRIIQTENPDVIITDIKMPKMDGLQMLEELYRDNCTAKAIVLSAYSEFEYARTAMRFGVSEYLLKPIGFNDFSQAIENIRMQIKKDRHKTPAQIGTLDVILKNILYGEMEPEQEVMEYLERNFELSADMKLAVLTEYYEMPWSSRQITRTINILHSLLRKKGYTTYCIIEDENKKLVHLIVYGYHDLKEIKRNIQMYYLEFVGTVQGISRRWIEAGNIYLLEREYRECSKYSEWNISLGDEVIISFPEITKVKTSVCIYPNEIEDKVKNAICMAQTEQIKENIDLFFRYFKKEKIYEPDKIKECYIRFFWAVLNYSKEILSLNKEAVEQQKFFEQIMNAKTQYTLQSIMEELEELVSCQEKEDVKNIIVKRMLSMIHECYSTGITLDEIAARMKLTPEYLGTQFHREMQVTFSTYMKNYRIGKAKELLLGTQLKLYQIAEMIGYSDPKYFSKVFKDVTGQLPAEYRKRI